MAARDVPVNSTADDLSFSSARQATRRFIEPGAFDGDDAAAAADDDQGRRMRQLCVCDATGLQLEPPASGQVLSANVGRRLWLHPASVSSPS